MTEPMTMARCHPEEKNYYGGKCEVCYRWSKDLTAPCPHDDRPKDKHGRCTSCMSRYYELRRLNGEGDRFGTIRSSRTLKYIVDPEERRKMVVRKRRARGYGLTLEQYNKMVEVQDGKCSICGSDNGGRELNIDHDHGCCPAGGSCGNCVRGLLCHGCNMRIGQIESDLSSRTLEYILRHKGGPLGTSEEIRIRSETGGEKGQKLARFELVPPRALWELAETYGRGSAKYGDHNWLRGYDWSLSMGALMRHAAAFWAGQSRDPKDGNHHLASVAWHAFALLEFEALGIGTDTRSFDGREGLESSDINPEEIAEAKQEVGATKRTVKK